MSREATIHALSSLFARFFDARRGSLTRRAARLHAEVLDHLREYLDTLGIRQVDLKPVDPSGDTLPGIPWLGQSVDVDTLIALFDDFQEDYLVHNVNAERTFLRVADVTLRGLSRWLRCQRTPTQPTRVVRSEREPTAAYPVIPRGCFAHAHDPAPAPRRRARAPHTPPRLVAPRAAPTQAYATVSAEQTGTMWRLDPFRAG
ncbi:MAG: hypothetical protein H6713_16630 [Myxococcales bacterium]|nr:hypothetical protein [Myxococcales bacterium]